MLRAKIIGKLILVKYETGSRVGKSGLFVWPESPLLTAKVLPVALL